MNKTIDIADLVSVLRSHRSTVAVCLATIVSRRKKSAGDDTPTTWEDVVEALAIMRKEIADIQNDETIKELFAERKQKDD